MINNDSETKIVCDFTYLKEMMSHKENLIKGIMDAFLKQIPDELVRMKEAVSKVDYVAIRSIAHAMKSSVSIMGISLLAPYLREMEDLGASAAGIEKIKELHDNVILICKLAVVEIEKEMEEYSAQK